MFDAYPEEMKWAPCEDIWTQGHEEKHEKHRSLANEYCVREKNVTQT